MKKNLIVLLVVFFLSGCGTVAVQPNQAALAKFTGKKTFAWLVDGVPSDDVRVNNPRVQKAVLISVDKNLAGKGYVKSAVNDADLLVSWFGSVDEEVKEIHMSSFYQSYGYSALKGARPESAAGKDGKVEQVFARGTLIIDILDPQSKTLIWRESATNTIIKKMSDAELLNYVDISVKHILEKLPDAEI